MSKNIDTKKAGPMVFPKKPSKPKVHFDGSTVIGVLPERRLGEFATISVGVAGEDVTTYTIHRVIGIDPTVDGDDWVVSVAADIPSLLKRAEDPNKAVLDERDRAAALQFVARSNSTLLERVTFGEGVFWAYPGDTVPRSDRVKAARAAAESASKGVDKAVPSDFISHLPAEYIEKERAILRLLKSDDCSEYQAKVNPREYRTGAGPLGDRYQVGLGLRGKSLNQVVDRMTKKLFTPSSRATRSGSTGSGVASPRAADTSAMLPTGTPPPSGGGDPSTGAAESKTSLPLASASRGADTSKKSQSGGSSKKGAGKVGSPTDSLTEFDGSTYSSVTRDGGK